MQTLAWCLVSKDALLAEDTKVFVDLIKQSKPNTYMIMVSHAMYPQIDPNHPSSLSKKIITDWLRKDMGYNGVVVTDDMDMGALAKHYTFGDMAVQSIQLAVTFYSYAMSMNICKRPIMGL